MKTHDLAKPRHNWTKTEINTFYQMPFIELLFTAQRIHREHFDPNTVQTCTLHSIKTGACPEDCKYCSQSGHYRTDIKREKLIEVEAVLTAAKEAKENGATRFCMGAAWRTPQKKDMAPLVEMVKGVKALGLETCATVGMLDTEQCQTLKTAGLDYVNHNLDTSPEYYPEVVTTRTYQQRLDTLENVRQADIKVCCGGILGLGESEQDRVSLLQQLVNQPQHPESVPINRLIQIPGTPLANNETVDSIEFIRSIAVARILMPRSFIRLSAGRDAMTDETQALCFMAGANSIFLGDKLLTAKNPEMSKDQALFEKLGIRAMSQEELAGIAHEKQPLAQEPLAVNHD